MDKSHVALTQELCPVCGNTHDTGIAIHKRLRPVLDSRIVTGWGLCPPCKEMKEKGFVTLVAVDEAKSTKLPNGTITPEGAHRLGPMVHINGNAWGAIFNCPIPPQGLAFCDMETVELLQRKMAEVEKMREAANEPG